MPPKTTIGLSCFSPGVLRLALAWLVVLFHTEILNLGIFAVYVFFVLSGYWISVMWNTKYQHCKNAYLIFMTSRYWRLLPLFLVSSALCALSVHFFQEYWAAGLPGAFNCRWWARTLLIAGLSWQPLALSPAWSLDAEMKFYFIAPLVIPGGYFFRRFGKQTVNLAMICIILGLFATWGIQGIKTAKYFAFFAVGMLAYATDWRPSRKLAITAACMVPIVLIVCWVFPILRHVYWINSSANLAALRQQDWIFCLMALGFTPFAVHTVHQSSSAMDRRFGDLAYATYIFHWAPVKTIGGLLHYAPISFQIAAWAVTLLGSVTLYLWIDVPIDALRRRFVNSRAVVRAHPAPDYISAQP